MVLKLLNAHQRSNRSAIRFSLRKVRENCPFVYLGFLVKNQMAFNGCRKKKKRRK